MIFKGPFQPKLCFYDPPDYQVMGHVAGEVDSFGPVWSAVSAAFN